MGNTWGSSSQNVPVKTTLMWTCEDHGFQSVEDCITLHQEAKWSLTHRIIFQKRKNGQRIKARGFIQRSTRADRWGCEGQRSLIGEDYITPMGRGSGGGGGQQIQPASLTNMCIVHCLRRQNLNKMGYLVYSEIALTQCFSWKSFRVDLTLHFDQMLHKQWFANNMRRFLPSFLQISRG